MTSFDLMLVPCRLTVQDPEFWKGLQPVTFGPLPRLQSQVTVIGYPCVPLLAQRPRFWVQCEGALGHVYLRAGSGLGMRK